MINKMKRNIVLIMMMGFFLSSASIYAQVNVQAQNQKSAMKRIREIIHNLKHKRQESKQKIYDMRRKSKQFQDQAKQQRRAAQDSLKRARDLQRQQKQIFENQLSMR